MLKQTLFTLIAATSLMTTQAALAGPDCTDEPRDQWMSELDMQKMIVNDMGYTIYKFKIDDTCYEIYGKRPVESDHDEDEEYDEGEEREMEKVEIYFNPVDGKVVKEKVED